MSNEYELKLKGVLRYDKTGLTQLIIANMFREYKKHIATNGQNKFNNFEEQKEIIQCFSKVVDSIKYIENSVDKNISFTEDNIDFILWISDSINLKENIEILVEKFLRVVDRNKEKIVIKLDKNTLFVTDEELEKRIALEEEKYWVNLKNCKVIISEIDN